MTEFAALHFQIEIFSEIPITAPFFLTKAITIKVGQMSNLKEAGTSFSLDDL